MLRFAELTDVREDSDDDKKKFAQLLYKQFFIDDKWKFNGIDVAKLDGWPKGLDIENFEVYAVGSDFVCFIAGGDWQEMALCTIKKAFNKNSLKIAPFDYYKQMDVSDIKTALENLKIVGSE